MTVVLTIFGCISMDEQTSDRRDASAAAEERRNPDAGPNRPNEPGSMNTGTRMFESDVPSCQFEYESMFSTEVNSDKRLAHTSGAEGLGMLHEPTAPFIYSVRGGDRETEINMPGYEDAMPRFERAKAFEHDRCYELPETATYMDEAGAYDLYARIAEETTGVMVDKRIDRRTVLGIRGAYPGTFSWNGNRPNRFNDTLVLLWMDDTSTKRVREFPAGTDTGVHVFGKERSSNLVSNRRYRYVNGWHGVNPYHALRIDEHGYQVRNDTNFNGHFDDDRNGWLPPEGDDYFRTGSGHNIHVASVDGPLGEAAIDEWSAGCQVIPGIENWEAFITNAWTGEGDEVDYFLVDVRDIPGGVWSPCIPDGSHECPYSVTLPFVTTGSTRAGAPLFDVYNCSDANESGPEQVYSFTTDRDGLIAAEVECSGPTDVDIYLLNGNDQNACLARGHTSVRQHVSPGRYWIIIDSYVDGEVLAGDYRLSVRYE